MKGRQLYRLGSKDVDTYRNLMLLFASEFEEKETYQDSPPSDEYVLKLLKDDNMIFLVEQEDTRVLGGLVAYVLRKFEQERSEVYIYDLAVHGDFRRQGVATRLIEYLRPIARSVGAWVIFVQADHGDDPAIKLYESLGEREDVLHFDIKP